MFQNTSKDITSVNFHSGFIYKWAYTSPKTLKVIRSLLCKQSLNDECLVQDIGLAERRAGNLPELDAAS